jgi:hypothetical protein
MDIRTANCQSDNGDFVRVNRVDGSVSASVAHFSKYQLINKLYGDPNGISFHITVGDVILGIGIQNQAYSVVSSNVSAINATLGGILGLATRRDEEIGTSAHALVYFLPTGSLLPVSEQIDCKFSF